MRIAVIDESSTRAAVIQEGLAQLEGNEIFVLSGRHELLARLGQIAPDVVLIDLGNPSRDVLEEYFAVSRALSHPIAMFVDESDEEAIVASIDAGVSVYVVDGLAASRIRPVLDLAVRRFSAFARLQADLDEAKGKLAERETIDQAKRILMNSRGRAAQPLAAPFVLGLNGNAITFSPELAQATGAPEGKLGDPHAIGHALAGRPAAAPPPDSGCASGSFIAIRATITCCATGSRPAA